MQLNCLGNELILENARRIAAMGVETVARLPLIPDFNMTAKNIHRTAQFASNLAISKIHLLPYHKLGQAKYRALGRICDWEEMVIRGIDMTFPTC